MSGGEKRGTVARAWLLSRVIWSIQRHLRAHMCPEVQVQHGGAGMSTGVGVARGGGWEADE